jgi:hypothetical protein
VRHGIAGVRVATEARHALEDLMDRGLGFVSVEEKGCGRLGTFTLLTEDFAEAFPDVAADDGLFQRADASIGGESFVYFVEAMHSGRIKIGVALDPIGRFKDLNRGQSPEPLRFLGCISGGYSLEAAIHRRFADSRVHGEWFLPTEPLQAYVRVALEEVEEASHAAQEQVP